jgi:hypothetical protein
MSQFALSEIELKIVVFLCNVGSANVPSQIASYIHETRDDTAKAVWELERKGILCKAPPCKEPDSIFLRSTREAVAFGLRKLT